MKRNRILFGIIASTLFLAAIGCRDQTSVGPQDYDGPNRAPVIHSVEATPDTFDMGEVTQVVCVAEDEDGDNLSYTWTDNVYGDITVMEHGDTVFYSGEACCGGLATLTVKVSDGKGGTAVDSITVFSW